MFDLNFFEKKCLLVSYNFNLRTYNLVVRNFKYYKL